MSIIKSPIYNKIIVLMLFCLALSISLIAGSYLLEQNDLTNTEPNILPVLKTLHDSKVTTSTIAPSTHQETDYNNQVELTSSLETTEEDSEEEEKQKQILQTTINATEQTQTYASSIDTITAQTSSQTLKLLAEAWDTEHVTSCIQDTTVSTYDLEIKDKIISASISGTTKISDYESYARIILIDQDNNEYLIYEISYPFDFSESIDFTEECFETCYLEPITPKNIRVESYKTDFNLDTLTYSRKGQKLDMQVLKQSKEDEKESRLNKKINLLNKEIKDKGQKWVAGDTPIARLSYSEKKDLFDGELPNLYGFEYYIGGIFEFPESETLDIYQSTAQTQPDTSVPSEWDWRDVHGENWLTSVKNQGAAGTCWAHAMVGALESQINLYYNQQIDPDLSEQMIVDCANLGPITSLSTYPISCKGENRCYPGYNYCKIMYRGITDEACDPYAERGFTSNPSFCDYDHICSDWPDRIWKLSDFHDYKFVSDYGTPDCIKQTMDLPETEFKRILVEKGPMDSGINSWNHAMVLVGYKGRNDWTTLDVCNSYTEYCTNDGCIRQTDPCTPGTEICTGTYMYTCNSEGHWDSRAICYGRCLNGECTKTGVNEEGDILCEFNLRKEYTPDNGDVYWIYKNSWGSDWGEDGYLRIAVSLENLAWGSLPQGPFIPPKGESYEIMCYDNDKDGYCNWGVSSQRPNNCPSHCGTCNDIDDDNPQLNCIKDCTELGCPDYCSGNTLLTQGYCSEETTTPTCIYAQIRCDGICMNNACVDIACRRDSDCDDDDPYTEETCINPGTLDSRCEYETYRCIMDSDCDDNNRLTLDYCVYPSTLRSYCRHRTIRCAVDEDCNDYNPYTKDICLNPGTTRSYCMFTRVTCIKDSDCDDKRAETFDICINPGELNAECQHLLNPNLPDLELSELRIQGTSEYQTVVRFKVSNLGKVYVEDASMKISIDTFQFEKSRQHLNLNPGEDIIVYQKLTFYRPGTYEVTAEIDSAGEITELNENNNAETISFERE